MTEANDGIVLTVPNNSIKIASTYLGGSLRNSRADSALALADALLSAPFEENGWDTALRRLANATGAGRTQLIAFGGAREIPLNWVTDPDPGFIEEFPLIDGGNPKVNWRVACKGRPLDVKWEHHYDEARRRLSSDIYDEFAERFDLPFGCQTVLLQTSDTFYGLATLRSTREGRTTIADRAAFAQAAPHVLTAIRLQQSFEHQGARLVAGAIDAMGGAVFVLDRAGRVQALTAAAEAMLREPIGLRMARRRLAANNPDDDRSLQAAIGAVLCQGIPISPKAPFWLRAARSDLPSHRCEVLPLPRRDWSLGFEPRALVSLHLPRELSAECQSQLKILLGLTKAEGEVATMIANGRGRDEIAAARGTSESTVSSQLKTIFQKAGVVREAELVALLNRLLR